MQGQEADETGGRGPQEGAAQPLALDGLELSFAPLRERRAKGRLADLTPDVVPIVRTASGEAVGGLRRGRDYELRVVRAEDGEDVGEVREAGDYQVFVTGTGGLLSGTATARLTVGRARRRAPLAVAALVALVAALVLALCPAGPAEAPWYDPNADEGQAAVYGDNVQDMLDAEVAEDTMNITVLNKVFFTDGTLQPGEIGFNNLPGNHFDQKLALALDETGEVLYESGAIRPGQNIRYITLDRDLKPGTYPATAAITGYDPETHEEVGTLNAMVDIVVEDAGA